MFIRNKGTSKNPRYALVESRRVKGKKHPRQVVILEMGTYKSLEHLERIWELMADDARKQDKSSELRQKYAPSMDRRQIMAHLQKIRNARRRYEWHFKAKEEKSRIADTVFLQGLSARSSRYDECILLMRQLREVIFTVRRDWPDDESSLFLSGGFMDDMKGVVHFYFDLVQLRWRHYK